ncbi:MAG TPA: secretin N-terminal domain-containing protein [Candidatus Eremiobacteraceae bacterium]|nr:secretin N-terminal domain-containing protein [Candidatus Eremiobacteraceae bacterium]
MHRHLRSAAAGLLTSVFGMSAGFAAQPTAGTGPNAVTDVSYGKQTGAFTVSVSATRNVTTHVQRFAVDTARGVEDLVIDLSPATFDGQTKVVGFSGGQIHQVRVGQFSESPAVMRIVVESHGRAQYDLHGSNGARTVTLAVHTGQIAYNVPAAQAAAPPKQVAKPATRTRTAQAAPVKVAAAPVKVAAAPVKVAPAPIKVAPAPSKVAAKPAKVAVKPAVPARPRTVAPSKPVAKPARPVQVALAPVPAATRNPWLPGGKFYCKVPGMPGYRGGSASSVSPHHGVMAASSSNQAPSSEVSANRYGGPRTVTLAVKNADVLDVLKLLANESGQNIVATQNVHGTVTVDLTDVPLKTALDLIVRSSGLDYRQVGNVYVVGTSADLAAEFGQSGQVAAQQVAFPIKYANPTDLAKQLATVIPATTFSIDARTDTLLVSGSPDIIQSARNFMALADIPAPQVVFEVKVVDITSNNDTNNSGISWAGSSPFDLFEDCKLCPPGTDISQKQVSGNPIAPQPFSRNALFVQGKLNYLITHNEAQLLANPRISALDNQPASLLVGTQYPIVYFDPKAGNFQVNYVDIGVKVNMTPVINSDGYITTTLHAERSTITGLVQTFPILDQREANSTLRVKDGDTIVLGGMLDDETTKSLSKIPLLGDIPIFGAFFRSIQTTKLHNEVVFLITPHIVAEK